MVKATAVLVGAVIVALAIGAVYFGFLTGPVGGPASSSNRVHTNGTSATSSRTGSLASTANTASSTLTSASTASSTARTTSESPGSGNPPYYSAASMSSTAAGGQSEFSVLWKDDAGLSKYVFSFDLGSGAFANRTATAFGTLGLSNATVTLPSTPGTKVRWRVFALDLAGRWNSTHTMCMVTGSAGYPTGTFALVVDDCYDLLAYDGTNLFNLGNLPGLFMTDTTFTGFHQVAYSNGTALAVGYNDALAEYKSSTHSLRPLNTGLSAAVGLNGVAFNPADPGTALISGDIGVLLKYSGGAVSRVPTGTNASLGKVGWSPDGNYALIPGPRGSILRYTASTGAVTTVPTGTSHGFGGISFSPDGSIALLVGGGGAVFEYSVTTGQTTQLTGVGDSYQFQTVAFSLDGHYALITSQNNVRGDLVMWARATGTFSNVTGGSTHTANGVAFSPDGSFAYASTTGGELLKVPYGQSTFSVIKLTGNRLRGIAWDPLPFLSPGTSAKTASETSFHSRWKSSF